MVFLRSAGWGAGFALTLSVVVGIFVWYSGRPKTEKPWNSDAIKATWTDLGVGVQEDKCDFKFRYSLENRTDRDYTVPSTAKVMMRLARDMSYKDAPDMTWDAGFIPAHQKLNIEIRVPFSYSDYNFSKAEADDVAILSRFADRRLSQLDGFALFDSANRFRIDFPNGWPEAGKRVNDSSAINPGTHEAIKVTLGPAECAARVRKAYPREYNDLDDATLTKKVLAKYPHYCDTTAPDFIPDIQGIR
jgi:hypothetical protein